MVEDKKNIKECVILAGFSVPIMFDSKTDAVQFSEGFSKRFKLPTISFPAIIKAGVIFPQKPEK